MVSVRYDVSLHEEALGLPKSVGDLTLIGEEPSWLFRSARGSGTRPARWPRSPKPMGVIADRTPRLRRYAEAVLAEPQPTPVLGIDDTHRGKPRWERCAATGRWVRVEPWDSGFVDLAWDQGLLGQRDLRQVRPHALTG